MSLNIICPAQVYRSLWICLLKLCLAENMGKSKTCNHIRQTWYVLQLSFISIYFFCSKDGWHHMLLLRGLYPFDVDILVSYQNKKEKTITVQCKKEAKSCTIANEIMILKIFWHFLWLRYECFYLMACVAVVLYDILKDAALID